MSSAWWCYSSFYCFLLLHPSLYAKALSPLSLSFSHFGGGGGTKMAEISVKLISQANQLARLSFGPMQHYQCWINGMNN